MKTVVRVFFFSFFMLAWLMTWPAGAQEPASSSTPAGNNTAQQDDRIVVRRSDLPPEVLNQIETRAKIQAYGEWVGIGKEIGTAVNEGLSALTKNADDLSKTDVGKFTMIMIAWKVMGWQLVHLIFGTVFFICGLIIFMWSWLLTGRTRKIKLGENNYELIHPSEEKLVGYGIWFIVHVLVTSLIVFTG